jgi:hypothetical protein
MVWIAGQLRDYPGIAIFLALAPGCLHDCAP